MTKSYYDVLGITPDATLEEIKDAYIKKSLELHPVNSKKDPKAFQEVSEAYQTLADPHKKYHYDHPYQLRKYDFDFINPHYLFKDFFNKGIFNELESFENMRKDFIENDEFFKNIDDVKVGPNQSYSKQVQSESRMKDGKKVTHTKTKVKNPDGTIHETEYEYIDDLKGHQETKELMNKSYNDKMVEGKK